MTFSNKFLRIEKVAIDPVVEPVVPGASKTTEHGRPTIEIQDGVTGFGAIHSPWPLAQHANAQVLVRLRFFLDAAGTGTKVRLAARLKSEGIGEDSSAAFVEEKFQVVTVTHTTIGEQFEGSVILDASGCELDDALALQFGRDGNNEIAGAGDNDDVDVAIHVMPMAMVAQYG